MNSCYCKLCLCIKSHLISPLCYRQTNSFGIEGLMGSHYVTQSGLKLKILPSQPTQCWDYSCVSSLLYPKWKLQDNSKRLQQHLESPTPQLKVSLECMSLELQSSGHQ